VASEASCWEKKTRNPEGPIFLFSMNNQKNQNIKKIHKYLMETI
jgi:hypothetical protein